MDIPERVLRRVQQKVTIDLDSGCWISMYSTGSHGYAQIGWSSSNQTTMVLAHRASWVAEHGAIPDGMTIDHRCYNRRCVNPKHLRLLTNEQNASDNGWARGVIDRVAHARATAIGIAEAKRRKVA